MKTLYIPQAFFFFFFVFSFLAATCTHFWNSFLREAEGNVDDHISWIKTQAFLVLRTNKRIHILLIQGVSFKIQLKSNYLMLFIFSIWPIYGTYVMFLAAHHFQTHSYFWKMFHFVNYYLFKMKKVYISLAQPPLQLKHRQVTWHQQSVTSPGDISSEVRNMSNNLCVKHPGENNKRLAAVSRSCDGKAKSLQVESALTEGGVAGCLAKSSIFARQRWPCFSSSQFYGEVQKWNVSPELVVLYWDYVESVH